MYTWNVVLVSSLISSSRHENFLISVTFVTTETLGWLWFKFAKFGWVRFCNEVLSSTETEAFSVKIADCQERLFFFSQYEVKKFQHTSLVSDTTVKSAMGAGYFSTSCWQRVEPMRKPGEFRILRRMLTKHWLNKN